MISRFRPLLPIVAAFVAGASTVSAQPSVTAGDIDRLTGTPWAGTLTYRDYSNDARTTIPSGLALERLAGAASDGTRWLMKTSYPDEPQANSVDTLTLAANGRRFRRAIVTERKVLADGTLRIVTEEDGRDNNRPARLRLVYLIGARTASIQKFVRYEGGAFFERHIYAWTR